MFNYSNDGHFYQWNSNGGATFAQARTASSAASYQGLRGYLVTITSAEEQSFINDFLRSIQAAVPAASEMWIGAWTLTDSDNQWRWADGPAGEVGVAFSSGNQSINGSHTNWDTAFRQPDGTGVRQKVISQSKQWVDGTYTGQTMTFIIEYSPGVLRLCCSGASCHCLDVLFRRRG